MDDDALAADSVLIEAGVKPRKWVQNARERAKAVKAFGIGSERFKDSDVRAHNMITVYEPVQPYEKITSIVTSQLILTKYVSLCQNEPVILPWSSAKGASAIHAAYGAYPMYPGERSAQSQYPAQVRTTDVSHNPETGQQASPVSPYGLAPRVGGNHPNTSSVQGTSSFVRSPTKRAAQDYRHGRA
eukprot:747538-Pyramimonas_sp.AAC.1